jgi:hypothetical protein
MAKSWSFVTHVSFDSIMTFFNYKASSHCILTQKFAYEEICTSNNSLHIFSYSKSKDSNLLLTSTSSSFKCQVLDKGIQFLPLFFHFCSSRPFSFPQQLEDNLTNDFLNLCLFRKKFNAIVTSKLSIPFAPICIPFLFN